MQLSANGISIEVEDHGSPSGEPLLLVMGLGMQLVAWHEDFVAGLVARGFRVIRFDNRDIGLSQRFDHLGVPNLVLDSVRFAFGMGVKSGYSVADMADDAVGVLDALGIRKAHVCGASMGGMIAQHMAVRHTQRLKSLTLMMTTSGSRRLPGPTLKVRGALISRPADVSKIDGIVDHYVRLYRLIGSPGYPATDEYLKERLGLAVRRSYRPQGTARQMIAIAADGNRSPWLNQIKLPVQVIHGRDDPLITLTGGEATAAAIPGAELVIIEGMGHDLPPWALRPIASALVANFERAEDLA